jgi:hypothetical protein
MSWVMTTQYSLVAIKALMVIKLMFLWRLPSENLDTVILT